MDLEIVICFSLKHIIFVDFNYLKMKKKRRRKKKSPCKARQICKIQNKKREEEEEKNKYDYNNTIKQEELSLHFNMSFIITTTIIHFMCLIRTFLSKWNLT